MKMGTYVEEIPIPYNVEEARQRIDKWRLDQGKEFKLVKKRDNWIRIKWKTLNFVITFMHQNIRIEGWVGGITKYSIDEKAIVGAIARRRGWSVYQTLKSALTN